MGGLPISEKQWRNGWGSGDGGVGTVKRGGREGKFGDVKTNQLTKQTNKTREMACFVVTRACAGS